MTFCLSLGKQSQSPLLKVPRTAPAVVALLNIVARQGMLPSQISMMLSIFGTLFAFYVLHLYFITYLTGNVVFHKVVCHCQKLKSGLYCCWDYEYETLNFLANDGQRNQVRHINFKKYVWSDIEKVDKSLNLAAA